MPSPRKSLKGTAFRPSISTTVTTALAAEGNDLNRIASLTVPQRLKPSSLQSNYGRLEGRPLHESFNLDTTGR